MTDVTTTAKTTPLVTVHQASGARMVNFAGFFMPMQYSGILDEHHAVRNAVGIFDVSHMGEIDFIGDDAIDSVRRLVPNDVHKLVDGKALYTTICTPQGGIVDDCLVYRLRHNHVRIVVNASNIEKDFRWFKKHHTGRCEIENVSDDWALIAVQGPRAIELCSAIVTSPSALKSIEPFAFAEISVGIIPCTFSRTGYTGEDGFEIFCAPDRAIALWNTFMEHGAVFGIKPCGLGARDTLRLEAALPLYGQDLDETTSPLEAGLGWTVKLNTGDFVGRDALIAQKQQGLNRKLVCLAMRSRGIARHGYRICTVEGHDDLATHDTIGTITSGTMSPSLDLAIAMGYVHSSYAAIGTRILVEVRGKPVEAEVIKGPFYRRSVPPTSSC